MHWPLQCKKPMLALVLLYFQRHWFNFDFKGTGFTLLLKSNFTFKGTGFTNVRNEMKTTSVLSPPAPAPCRNEALFGG